MQEFGDNETNVALVFVQGETPSLESIRRLIQEELAKELQGETKRVESAGLACY